VDDVIERCVQNREARRDRVDLFDRFGKSLLAPLKVQEEAVAAKAKHAGVRIRHKGRISRDEQRDWAFLDIIDCT